MGLKEKVSVGIGVVLVIIVLYAISLAVTVGFVWLACYLFGLHFSMKIAIGIWVVICAIKLLLPSKKAGN